MTMINNREAFLAVEPEIDMTQFKHVTLDLPYANDSQNQIMDIIYPEDGEGPYPVVLIMHGGAFCAGHKRSVYLKSMMLPATQGYAVATVEYRLLQEAQWPAQLVDGKAALRYLHTNAKELNIDPDKIAVWGNSAGGTVTQLMALSGNDPTCDDLSVGVEGSSRVDCSIAWYTISDVISMEQFGIDIKDELLRTGAGKGMLPNDGKTDGDTVFTKLLGYSPLHYPEKAYKASPISYVTKDCPPMLIQHGTNDLVVDYHQSVYMYEKIVSICGEDRAELELFDNEPHGSQAIKANENITRCIDFLDKHLYEGNNPYRKEFPEIRVLE